MTRSRNEAFQRVIRPERVRAAQRERERLAEFCERQGIAVSPTAVTLYLVENEAEGSRALGRRLARLDLACYLNGEAPLGAAADVRRFIHAMRSVHPLGAVNPKSEPLYAGHVRHIVDAIMAPSWSQHRDVAYLSVLQASGLRPTEVEALTWSDIHLASDQVIIRATLRKSRVVPVDVQINLPRTGSLDCPVTALRQLRVRSPQSDGLIFATRGDHVRNRRLRALALEITRYRSGPQVLGRPTLPAGTMRRILRGVLEPPLLAVRDRALVLVGFYGALSTVEALALSFDDVLMSPRGLTLSLPQRPFPQVGVPARPGDPYCPVAAWATWATAVRRIVGSTQDLPAFLPCDPTQPLIRMQRLWDGALQDVVQRRAAAADLDGRYGFNSLRDGFIRSALHTDASVHDLQRQAGFKVMAGVRRRQAQETLLTDNTARLLGL